MTHIPGHKTILEEEQTPPTVNPQPQPLAIQPAPTGGLGSTVESNFFLRNGKVTEIADPTINPQLTAGATKLTARNLAAATKEAEAIELAKNQGTTTETDAVVSTDNVIQGERDTAAAVAAFRGPDSNFDNLTITHEADITDIESQTDALEKRREQEVASLNEQFDELRTTTVGAQKRETGTFATGLSRIGGFLGESASSIGALRNLATEHRAELKSLASKRATAINEANQAITDKQFELAREKAEAAKDFEKEIDDRRNKFFDQSLKLTQEQRQQDERRDTIKNQVRDDARSSLNTIITNFGGIDFNSLDDATAADYFELASLAGIPVESLAQPTLKQESQRSTEDQRAITNALAAARLSIQQSSLALSQQRFEEGEKLNAVDAQRLGLPKLLVGLSENDVETQLRDETPPDWFVEIEEGKADGVKTREALDTLWEEFRTEILTTSAISIFGAGGIGGGLPAPITEGEPPG